MGFREKLSFHRWNVGFIESSISDIIEADKPYVNWVRHDYTDRFFADPFILDYDDERIRVLVEEYPFFTRRGVVSMLIVDRKSYDLVDKHTIIDKEYHQSYPFILRHKGKTYIVPEASQSGGLWIYEFDGDKVTNRELIINEPLLDSTIIEYDGRWWLFCTKRGNASNKDLFMYVSDDPLSGYKAIYSEPVKCDLSSSRPAGYMIEQGGELFRVTQNCSETYGGGVQLTKITDLSENSFREILIKPIDVELSDFKEGFHTINEYRGLTVVDGIKSEFRPLRKILYTLKSKLG